MIPKKFLAISLIMFLVSTVFVSSTSHVAYACSCMQPLSPNEEMPKFDAVFSGKVIEIIEKHPSWPSESSTDPVFATIDVYTIWKGEKNKTITVKTASSSASCGFNFEKNQEYIIYAASYNNEEEEGDDDLQVSLCSRTGLLSDADVDLQALGTGYSTMFEIGKILPPLKQLKAGTPSEEVQCNEGLNRAFKYDSTPVCVSENAAIKLTERGWLNSDPRNLLF